MVDGDSTSLPPSKTATVVPEPEGKTITEHLNELRNRIIISFGFIVLGCVASFYTVKDYLLPWLMGPILRIPDVDLQVLSVQEKFLTYFKIGFAGGFLLAAPFILFQVWQFIHPGLTDRERKAVRGLLLTTLFLFLAGAAFTFYLILPVALTFLLEFELGVEVTTEITMDKYFSFSLFLILAGGLVFQIPLVAYFLSMVGLLSPQFMARYRRYAFLGAVILGAALTPTGDPVTLALLAIPIYLLYEASIIVSAVVFKQRQREE